MDDIYNTLSNYLKSSKSGVNEIIARYVLVSLNKIPHMRAADVAEACHTSASSVVWFCRELGYDGYDACWDAVGQDAVYLPTDSFQASDCFFESLVPQWVKGFCCCFHGRFPLRFPSTAPKCP